MHRWKVKPQVKCYLISVLMAALLLAGCATGPADKQAQSNAADRVMAAYDVADLLDQAAPAVSQSLNKNLPEEIGASERERLRAAIVEAYDPQQLQDDVQQRLRENADNSGKSSALVSAAQALETPLAARMIGLEAKTGETGFAANFREFIDQPASAERKQRLRQIDLLANDMQIIELQASFNVTLLEAMIRARNAASPDEYHVPEQRVDQMVGETRSNIHGQLEKRVPLMLLYVYRDVTDSELQAYAQLQGRPELAWTNEALKNAIISALDSASERVIDNYNKAS